MFLVTRATHHATGAAMGPPRNLGLPCRPRVHTESPLLRTAPLTWLGSLSLSAGPPASWPGSWRRPHWPSSAPAAPCGLAPGSTSSEQVGGLHWPVTQPGSPSLLGHLPLPTAPHNAPLPPYQPAKSPTSPQSRQPACLSCLPVKGRAMPACPHGSLKTSTANV